VASQGGDGIRLVVEPRQVGQFGGASFQRRYQRTVLDVVAESIETDFVGGKPDLGRTDQPASIVDQTHRLQWRRLVRAAPPYIQSLQKIHGAAQEGGGAIIGIGRAASDQGRIRAGLCQGNRRRQSGGATTNHDDVVGTRYFVHTSTIDVPRGIFKPASLLQLLSSSRAAERRNHQCANRRDS
jgi:hypothetical protein